MSGNTVVTAVTRVDGGKRVRNRPLLAQRTKSAGAARAQRTARPQGLCIWVDTWRSGGRRAPNGTTSTGLPISGVSPAPPPPRDVPPERRRTGPWPGSGVRVGGQGSGVRGHWGGGGSRDCPVAHPQRHPHPLPPAILGLGPTALSRPPTARNGDDGDASVPDRPPPSPPVAPRLPRARAPHAAPTGAPPPLPGRRPLPHIFEAHHVPRGPPQALEAALGINDRRCPGGAGGARVPHPLSDRLQRHGPGLVVHQPRRATAVSGPTSAPPDPRTRGPGGRVRASRAPIPDGGGGGGAGMHLEGGGEGHPVPLHNASRCRSNRFCLPPCPPTVVQPLCQPPGNRCWCRHGTHPPPPRPIPRLRRITDGGRGGGPSAVLPPETPLGLPPAYGSFAPPPPHGSTPSPPDDRIWPPQPRTASGTPRTGRPGPHGQGIGRGGAPTDMRGRALWSRLRASRSPAPALQKGVAGPKSGRNPRTPTAALQPPQPLPQPPPSPPPSSNAQASPCGGPGQYNEANPHQMPSKRASNTVHGPLKHAHRNRCFTASSSARVAPPPRVTVRRVVVPLRGPGQSPVLPFACCVGSLRSVGRCGRCSCWCRCRVRGAQRLVYAPPTAVPPGVTGGGGAYDLA